VDVLIVRVGVRVAICGAAGIGAAPVVVGVLRTECVVVLADRDSVGCELFVHVDYKLVLVGVLDSRCGIKECSRVT